MDNTKTGNQARTKHATQTNASPVSEALEAFLQSPDFERGVIEATKAAQAGSGYSVELSPDKSWQLIENTQRGVTHDTNGVLVELPILRVNETSSGYDDRIGGYNDTILHETFIQTQETMKNSLRETLETFSQR